MVCESRRRGGSGAGGAIASVIWTSLELCACAAGASTATTTRSCPDALPRLVAQPSEPTKEAHAKTPATRPVHRPGVREEGLAIPPCGSRCISFILDLPRADHQASGAFRILIAP